MNILSDDASNKYGDEISVDLSHKYSACTMSVGKYTFLPE